MNTLHVDDVEQETSTTIATTEQEEELYIQIVPLLDFCLESSPCKHDIEVLTRKKVDDSIVKRQIEHCVGAQNIIKRMKDNGQKIPRHFNYLL
jgi:hypothetical protein